MANTFQQLAVRTVTELSSFIQL